LTSRLFVCCKPNPDHLLIKGWTRDGGRKEPVLPEVSATQQIFCSFPTSTTTWRVNEIRASEVAATRPG